MFFGPLIQKMIDGGMKVRDWSAKNFDRAAESAHEPDPRSQQIGARR